MKYYTSNNDLPGPLLKTPERRTFHRPQHLQVVKESIGDVDIANGLRIEDAPSPGQVALLQQKTRGIGGDRLNYVAQDEWDCKKSTEERLGWSQHKLRPLSIRECLAGRDAEGLPKWVRLEKQVLKFDTYFVEDVFAERIETQRIRKCHIFYYLEDDSMMVVEPSISNSGIPQGTLVRRHRVPFETLPEEKMAKDELPRPPPRVSKEKHITFWDMNRSKDLVIYGRRHRITDCDQFTEDFLAAQGIQVNPKEPEPDNAFRDYRARIDAVTPRRPYKRPNTPRSFDSYEGKVLRFFGRWVDEVGQIKEIRTLVVRFHLEDDTVEVGEIHDVNSGRYKAPLFLKRCKLPKNWNALVTLPGMATDHTILNVVRSQGPGRSRDAILIDNLEVKPGSVIAACGSQADPNNFYMENDFDIGKRLSIAGREVLLFDCDKFTREYFRRVHNKVLEPLDLGVEVKKDRQKEVAPYTGFGTEEDSKTSCQGLEPRAPQRDFFKFMHKDRDGFDSHILRFSARLIVDGKVDVKRKFVVSYFLSDDTILVTLVPEQNSGMTGGRFMKRERFKKPKDMQSPDMRLDSLHYNPPDLYVGAIVEFNKHTFLLTSADEYVFSYMERPTEREGFPQSNIRLILDEVVKCVLEKGGPKPLMSRFLGQDPSDSGQVMERTFRDILHEFVGYNLSEHQLITIVRAYRSDNKVTPTLPTASLYSILQAELKRINFQFFDHLYMNLREKDINGTGKMSKEALRINLCSGLRPAKSQLRLHNVNHLVEMLIKSFDQEELDYAKVINELNWMTNPARPVAPQLVKTNFDDQARQKEYVPVQYRQFVEDLERKVQPERLDYIATEEDFKNDRER